MNALVLALGAALLAQDPSNLRWPVGDGDHAFPLRATYGQLEGNKGNWNLHLGLDILGYVPLEPVLAIEDGKVLIVARESTYGEYAGVLVESKARPGHAFLYKHIEQIVPAKGTDVKAGDVLGYIQRTNVTDDPHLHLSRVAGSFKKKDWYDLDQQSERNPLALLKQGLDGDDLAPRLARNKEVSFVTLKPDDGESIAAVESSVDAAFAYDSAATGEWKDVVVRAFDIDRVSWHLLAPYRLRLSVETGSSKLTYRTIVLDGPLVHDDNLGLYSFKPGTSSAGWTKDRRYDYFFVLTNAGFVGGDKNAWLATPGKHTLHVEVEDVAGNVKKIEQELVIP